MTVPEIQALGMTQNAKGWWMLPVRGQPSWAVFVQEGELEEATPTREQMYTLVRAQ
jgi:hypothetical protein